MISRFAATIRPPPGSLAAAGRLRHAAGRLAAGIAAVTPTETTAKPALLAAGIAAGIAARIAAAGRLRLAADRLAARIAAVAATEAAEEPALLAARITARVVATSRLGLAARGCRSAAARFAPAAVASAQQRSIQAAERRSVRSARHHERPGHENHREKGSILHGTTPAPRNGKHNVMTTDHTDASRDVLPNRKARKRPTSVP